MQLQDVCLVIIFVYHFGGYAAFSHPYESNLNSEFAKGRSNLGNLRGSSLIFQNTGLNFEEGDFKKFIQEEKEVLIPGSQLESRVPKRWELTTVPLNEFRQSSLKWHNQYRKKHQVSSLTIDEKLNDYAQEWAEYLAAKNLFKHRTNGKYGENIFKGYGKAWTAEEVVTMFYAEVENYDFNTHTKKNPSDVIGHFTQLVWKGSQKLGVGMAYDSKTRSTYVVMNYDPPGNYRGRYSQNVFPNIY